MITVIHILVSGSEYHVHGGRTSFDNDNFEINVFIDGAIK